MKPNYSVICANFCYIFTETSVVKQLQYLFFVLMRYSWEIQSQRPVMKRSRCFCSTFWASPTALSCFWLGTIQMQKNNNNNNKKKLDCNEAKECEQHDCSSGRWRASRWLQPPPLFCAFCLFPTVTSVIGPGRGVLCVCWGFSNTINHPHVILLAAKCG